MHNKTDTIVYYPCLLQRLKDDDPKSKKDITSHQKNDFDSIRKIIINNIFDIINAQNLEYQIDQERYPFLVDSVINYGVLPHLGDNNFTKKNHHFESELRKAIIRFEPRLIADSVRVKTNTNSKNTGVILTFELEALVFWLPEPRDLCLKLNYDKQLNQFDFL